MARSHVLDWLAANHQVWYEQFLVLGDGGNEVSDLRRIDNSVIWFLMNSDSLNINYQNPSMHHLSRVGYLYFWRVFLERGFELSLQDVYKWAVFISKFANAQYMELFKRGLENNLASFSNNGTNDLKNQWWQTPEIVKKAPRREDVPKLLLKRKQNLADDLRRVYSELASLRDEKFDPERNDGVAQVAQALIERLDKKMAQLLADEKALDALPRKTQARMEIPVPLDAYWTLRPIVSIPWQPPKQQDQAFARIEQNLREQMAREPSSEGKRLIQNALVNFAKMKRLREMVWDKKFPFETFRHMMLDQIGRAHV